ncbi:MAG: dihydroorotate dehydrogenase electron transfer subunit [Bacteroidales bacterium]|nr:dihydroorotate dehydrogenase electron transfer subunit [Bacteroidales bacterium]
MNYFESNVISNKQLTDDIFVLEVERKDATAAAGQFFMLKCWDNELTLMRPISIFKAEADTLHFMYRVIGKGTQRLSQLHKGDKLQLLGALGTGYPIQQVHGRIALVGGGLGIPPLCQTAKELAAHGAEVVAHIGYRDKLFALEDFKPYCKDVLFSIEKGEIGYHGFVTDLLKPEQFDAVFTCGPEIMMRKVAAMCAEKGVACWCSMENRMACGIGACLGCSIKTTEGMKRCCKDGPVFRAETLFQ